MADFPNLAGYSNTHIWQYDRTHSNIQGHLIGGRFFKKLEAIAIYIRHIRLPKRLLGGTVAYFQILQEITVHTYGNRIEGNRATYKTN